MTDRDTPDGDTPDRDTPDRDTPDRGRLAAALGRVRARIAAAEVAASRPPGSVTLVAVSKTWPAADVVALARLGVVDFGENRAGEATLKTAEVAASGVTGLRWHFVGQVQSRKAADVAGCCGTVESVDRVKLVSALAKACDASGRELEVLLQVDLDGSDPGRGGAAPEQLVDLAAAVGRAGRLALAGLMAVAPRGADPVEAFGRLADLHRLLQVDHPGATVLSAGMSGDLEHAVAAGATHVRIGSALFGGRAPLSG